MNKVVIKGYSDTYLDEGCDVVNTKMCMPLYEAFSNVTGRPSIYLAYELDVSLAYRKRDDVVISIATHEGVNEYPVGQREPASLYEKMTKAIYIYFNENSFNYGGLNLYFESAFSCDNIDVYYYAFLLIKALNAAYNEEKISKDTILDCLAFASSKVIGASYDGALIAALVNRKNAKISVIDNKATYQEIDFPFAFDSYLLSFPESNFLSPNKLRTESLLKRINDTVFMGRRYSQIDKGDFHAALSVPLYDVDEITKLKAHVLYDDLDYTNALDLAIQTKDEGKFTNTLRSKTMRDVDLFYFDAPSKDKIFTSYLLSNYPTKCIYMPFPYSSSVVVLLRKGEKINEFDFSAFPNVKITHLNYESED